MITYIGGPAQGCTHKITRAPRLLRVEPDGKGGFVPLIDPDVEPWNDDVYVYYAPEKPVPRLGPDGVAVDYSAAYYLIEADGAPLPVKPNAAWREWATLMVEELRLHWRPTERREVWTGEPEARTGLPDAAPSRRGHHEEQGLGGGLFGDRLPKTRGEGRQPAPREAKLPKRAADVLAALRRAPLTDSSLVAMCGANYGEQLHQVRRAGFLVGSRFDKSTRRYVYTLLESK